MARKESSASRQTRADKSVSRRKQRRMVRQCSARQRQCPSGHSFTLGNFPDIRSKRFPQWGYPSQLDQSDGWPAYVNGKPFAGDFHTMPRHSHTLVTLAYQRPDVQPATSFNWGGLQVSREQSLGLGVPFLLLGLGLNQVSSILKWLRPHLGKIEVGTGVVMILMGVMIYFNWLVWLNKAVQPDLGF